MQIATRLMAIAYHRVLKGITCQLQNLKGINDVGH